MTSPSSTTTGRRVCIVGGGPAGLVAGLLLARGGLDVTVLEEHADFLRDFRGDTIHPTTLDLVDQLGLLDDVRSIDHTVVTTLDAVVGGVRFTAADFRHVGSVGELWFMPQWDLLDLLARQAARYPRLTLLRDTEAVGVTRTTDGRVSGIQVRSAAGDATIEADLVVAADGRDSVVRDAAGLDLTESGVPIDVLWFRIDRPPEDPPDTIAYIDRDVLITVPRDGYYQVGLLVDDGGFEQVREDGLAAFHARVVAAAPFLAPTVGGVESLDDVHVLNVRIAMAERWHTPGVVLIGDAAHPMSPAFGVGINYAVQDAVALSHLLLSSEDLRAIPSSELDAFQHRRASAAGRMQTIQRFMHRRIARPHPHGITLPAPALRAATTALGPVVRPLLGRLVGQGFRPERVEPD